MSRNKEQFFGWKFPVKPDLTTGRIQGSSYEETIAESIRIILMTKKGERVMRPEFGCDINKFMFEILDITTIKQIEYEVKDALKKWEPRIENIKVHAVQSKQKAGQININISYTLLKKKDLIHQMYTYDINN